jgi:hypothetical protein
MTMRAPGSADAIEGIASDPLAAAANAAAEVPKARRDTFLIEHEPSKARIDRQFMSANYLAWKTNRVRNLLLRADHQAPRKNFLHRGSQ